MSIETQPGFQDMDAAYRSIIEAHRGLDDTQSAELNAALVLILANQIGDPDMLAGALTMARNAIAKRDIQSPD